MIHVAHIAPAAKKAVSDQSENHSRLQNEYGYHESLEKVMVLNPPPQQSPTPRGHEEDETNDDKGQDRDDVDRAQEPAHSDVYDLCEFTMWYLINMSGNTADCFFGGQRSRDGGYTTERENQRDDFDTDDVIEGQRLPDCVGKPFSGVYYDHPYMSLAKLVAYEIGSLLTSLNWIRQVQRQSYQDEEVLEAAFKELVKDQTVEGFRRFAGKIRYKIERHSKSRYGRKLKASARWEPSIPQKRKKALQEQPSPKKRARLFNRPWWATDPSNPRGLHRRSFFDL